jgi:hypothetical protein
MEEEKRGVRENVRLQTAGCMCQIEVNDECMGNKTGKL